MIASVTVQVDLLYEKKIGIVRLYFINYRIDILSDSGFICGVDHLAAIHKEIGIIAQRSITYVPGHEIDRITLLKCLLLRVHGCDLYIFCISGFVFHGSKPGKQCADQYHEDDYDD